MSFEIITAETRTERMITWFSGICSAITDFIAGSVIRSKFESVAVEMEAQDLAFYQAAKKAITAGAYQAFAFATLPAVTARGTVTFSRETPSVTDIIIPATTMVATETGVGVNEKTYTTTQEVILLSGLLDISAEIICTQTGSEGNTPLNTITVMKTAVQGINSVTNTVGIRSGRDAETGDERYIRFQSYIPTLRRGTESAVIVGAKTAAILADGVVSESVKSVLLSQEGAGYVKCYIYNGAATASDALIARAQEIIDGYNVYDNGTITERVAGYKAAGVTVEVISANTVTQEILANVTTNKGVDTALITANIEQAIEQYMSGLDIGDSVIRSAVIERIQSVDGVYNTDLILPVEDVTPSTGSVIVAGGLVTVNLI